MMHGHTYIKFCKLVVERLNLSYEYKYYGPDISITYGILEDLVTGDFDIMFGTTHLHEKILPYGKPSFSYYETGYKW